MCIDIVVIFLRILACCTSGLLIGLYKIISNILYSFERFISIFLGQLMYESESHNYQLDVLYRIRSFETVCCSINVNVIFSWKEITITLIQNISPLLQFPNNLVLDTHTHICGDSSHWQTLIFASSCGDPSRRQTLIFVSRSLDHIIRCQA